MNGMMALGSTSRTPLQNALKKEMADHSNAMHIAASYQQKKNSPKTIHGKASESDEFSPLQHYANALLQVTVDPFPFINGEGHNLYNIFSPTDRKIIYTFGHST